MSAPTLRPYQQAQLAAVDQAIASGQRRILIKSPTGTGKTVTFAAMLEHGPLRDRLARWKKTGARMLVIAHREELLDQAAAKIQAANPGTMVSIEQGDRHAHRYSQVVVASIQTLAAVKFRRLKRLLDQHGHFPLVIVDEAHHAAAASYRTALVHLGFLPPADATDQENLEAPDFDDLDEMNAALEGWDKRAPTDRVLVGVTATPNRSDAVGLSCVFQTIAYSYALRQAIEDKYLVPIRPWVVESDVSLDNVRTTAGDFNQRELADAVNQEQRNKLAVASWFDHAEGLPTLAFTVDVAHAHALASEFRGRGVRAQAISGETPKDDRRQYLRAFSDGQIDVLTNCMVLTEGTDLPLTQCILHAKPTKSATLYEQMTGRGLRIHPGKRECIVIDIVDVARRHSLQAAPVLYGLPTSMLTKGEELGELREAVDAILERTPTFSVENQGRLTLAQLQARASSFDVWQIPDLGAMRTVVSMQWIRVGDDTYRMSYPWQEGTETLVVQRDLVGHFEIAATYRTRPTDPGVKPETRQRTIGASITECAAALNLAEAFVQRERRQASRLRDREAPWRRNPASPKQLALLKKWKVPHNPKGMTSGAASDLIDLAVARRRPG